MRLGRVGDFEGAIKAFQRSLDLQPNSAEAHYNLGLALLANSGNVPAWKDALPHFEAAAALEPKYFPARRMSGVARLETGDSNNAMQELKAALSLEPSSAATHFDLGRALAAAGDGADPSSEYLAALRLKSPYPEADNALATLLLTRQQTKAAIEHFNSALAAQPDLESAHYGLGRALKAEQRLEDSKLELKAASLLLQRQSDAVLSSHLSNESLDRAKQGDSAAAMAAAKKAIWLNPANALANFNLGLLLADAGNPDAAIHQIRKAISLAPYRPLFYLDLSRVEQSAGQPGDALATLRKAVEVRPDDAAVFTALKKAEAEVLAAASSQASSKQEAFPFGAATDTADGHLAFANRLSSEGDFLGAIGELRRALNSEPARSDLRYNLAVASIQIARYDEAEYELRTSLRLAPESVPAHLALGSLLFQQKDFPNAASEFRRVLALQPQNDQAQKLLKECRP